jgi:hypothetical protein
MMIKFTKRLLVLGLAIVVFLTSEITVAAANNSFTSSKGIFTLNQEVISQTAIFADDDLTPQELQGLQSVRQRRNKEIGAVLNSQQRTQVAHELHTGNNIDQALARINLQPEQQKLINSIIEFTNLKMKAIFSRHVSLKKMF